MSNPAPPLPVELDALHHLAQPDTHISWTGAVLRKNKAIGQMRYRVREALEARGWIRREPVRPGAALSIWRITDSGREVLAEGAPVQ